MSSVTRVAGAANTFLYTLTKAPYSAPVMTVYSDAGRTAVAVAPTALVATADPTKWTASVPNTLAAGTYYLSFSTVLTAGGTPLVDADDSLVLVASTGILPAPLPSYASLAALRKFGLSTSISDADALEALDLSSRIIDDYTGTQFYAVVETQVYNDVRLPLVRFRKLPYSGLTEVRINNQVLGPSAYTQEPWGLRLYIPGVLDIDGFPRKAYNMLGGQNLGSRFGQQVSVTATFGYTGPTTTVSRGCVLLAARVAIEGVASLIPDSRLKSLNVEGYARSWDHKIGEEPLDTTGDTQVDRLLRRYRSEAVQVG